MLDTIFAHWSVNDCIHAHALGVKFDFSAISELKDSETCNCAVTVGRASFSALGVCYYCGRKRRKAELLTGARRFEPVTPARDGGESNYDCPNEER